MNGAVIESLEVRALLALAWGPTARLVNLDDAVNAYPSVTGAGVAVAVVDSGINYNHPALGGGFGAGHRVVAGYDFVDNDPDPMDTDGHGTEVAGVIAARPFDWEGAHYQGVAPNANLVALRVTHGDDGASDSNIEKALDWVIANHKKYSIKVVNLSLGAGDYSDATDNSTLSDEFVKLVKLDVLVFAASGNDGPDGTGIQYPAADENVAAVGAVDRSDRIADFTQRGPLLDLLAPGDSVPTTNLSGQYTAVEGTSFASPYAAGAAALVRQRDPSLSSAGVLSVLRASGAVNKDGDDESASSTTGLVFPRVDLFAALKLTDSRKASSKNLVGTRATVSDIAYDAQGILHLAYYDPNAHTIRYATRDTDGLWSKTSLVDTSGDDVGAYLSIAIDPTGKPAIAYYDATRQDLKYAHHDGEAWDVSTRDGNKTVGQYASLTFDSNGRPVIGYYRKTGGDLKVLTQDDSGNWIKYDVDSAGDVGTWSSVAAADTAGIIAVAYADRTTGDLKYARYSQGAWTIFTVDDLKGVAYTNLNIHNNQAFISYQDTSNGDLKFARRADGTWFTEIVYRPGNSGQYSSIVFDSNDTAHVVFFNKSRNLTYQAEGSFGSWSISKVATGGTSLSAAASDDEDTLSFVSLDTSRKKLQIGVVDSV